MADNLDDYRHIEEYNITQLEDDNKLMLSLLEERLRLEVGDEIFGQTTQYLTRSKCITDIQDTLQLQSCPSERESMQQDVEYLSDKLTQALSKLSIEHAVPFARFCAQYLHLTGITEMNHRIRKNRLEGTGTVGFEQVFERLLDKISPSKLYESIVGQDIEIVLTAHPTQVNRGTMQQKYIQMSQILEENDRLERTQKQKEYFLSRLNEEVTAVWMTDELRRKKPSPIDEAHMALQTVQQSIWEAVPQYLERLSKCLQKYTDRELPITSCPIRFGSWMGGDRDGNPNVTAAITNNVCAFQRKFAADMYLKDIEVLREKLSMSTCNQEVYNMAKLLLEEQKREDDNTRYTRQDHLDMAYKKATKLKVSVESQNLNKIESFSQRALLGSPLSLSRYDDMRLDNLTAETGMSPKVAPSPTAIAHQLCVSPEYVATPNQVGSTSPASVSASSQHMAGKITKGHSGFDSKDLPVTETQRTSVPSTLSAGEVSLSKTKSMSDYGFNPANGGRGGSESTPETTTGEQGQMDLAFMDANAALGRGQQLYNADDRIQALQGQIEDLQSKKTQRQSQTGISSTKIRGQHPYRVILNHLKMLLINTHKRMEAIMCNTPLGDSPWIERKEQLLEPLMLMYKSLLECNAYSVADGDVKAFIRRVACFGLNLMKIDLRQESTCHADAMTTITEYLELGKYSEWSENDKVAWLIKELKSKRPLVSREFELTLDPSTLVHEVIQTFMTAVRLGKDCISSYVISMASQASDVLVVMLLFKVGRLLVAYQSKRPVNSGEWLQVVPLFETLDDLDRAPQVIDKLLSNTFYRDQLRKWQRGQMQIMLGYSDSGKDAGRLAANWALYRAQERLVYVCKKYRIKLTLFHGRGGSIGRGGGPMHMAIQSQPPGSVNGQLRITEQGEMVSTKFGFSTMAVYQMELYTTAVLAATVDPPNAPSSSFKQEWIEAMNDLSSISCEFYRDLVFVNPSFIPYFTKATPEKDLGMLNIGSRPARRKQDVTVSSLRAIPWIFAWTQTRCILPTWYGVGYALEQYCSDESDPEIAEGRREMLQCMYNEWPFFQATIDLVEMVLKKADMRIQSMYDKALLADEPQLQSLGVKIREEFSRAERNVLAISGHSQLCENNAVLRRLVSMRNPFIDPLNVLQVKYLQQVRQSPDNQDVRDALHITINGIAAGMRNTG